MEQAARQAVTQTVRWHERSSAGVCVAAHECSIASFRAFSTTRSHLSGFVLVS